MKKFLSILLTLVLAVSFCALGVSAAGINANEQAILDKLSSTVSYNGKTFNIPDNYINQAKNYFLANDISEAQAEEIIAKISVGEEVVKEELKSSDVEGTVFHMSNFSKDAREKILSASQDACKVVNLTLTYTDKTVTIVDNNTSETVFEDAPVIKTTGAEVAFGTAFAVFAVAFMGFAVMALKKAR